MDQVKAAALCPAMSGMSGDALCDEPALPEVCDAPCAPAGGASGASTPVQAAEAGLDKGGFAD